MMNEGEKSDRPIVPTKRPNNAGQRAAAEDVEGRGLTEGNAGEQNAGRTQSRTKTANSELDRVRGRAKRDKEAKFTALLHHVTVDRLRDAYRHLNRKAASGVDGVTWVQYGEQLEENLRELHARLHRGAYRARPSRRVFIPKSDGRQRPLGIATLEDKVVQRAVVEVLNAIYEEDFLGFSYGFRPGRGQHDALDALAVAIKTTKVNWVLDADIRGFFDAIDHGWLVKFVEHRIGDRRVVRLIQKWLRAGVLEDGRWTASTVGSPQGATVSPLLANIYLHYVLDLWAHSWRRRQARGAVCIVRYADDFLVGFEHEEDGRRFLAELRRRLQRFGLELHPDKTRLMEFGRFANSLFVELPRELAGWVEQGVAQAGPDGALGFVDALATLARQAGPGSDPAAPLQRALAELLVFEALRLRLLLAVWRSEDFERLGGEESDIDAIAWDEVAILLDHPALADARVRTGALMFAAAQVSVAREANERAEALRRSSDDVRERLLMRARLRAALRELRLPESVLLGNALSALLDEPRLERV